LNSLAEIEGVFMDRLQNMTIEKPLVLAGRTAAGLCAIGYFSGMSLFDGVFSGRRAGAHAAQCHPESTRIHPQADVAQSDLLRSFT